ncbi:vacuolar DHA amino acid exporter [Amanita muscaria]
MPEPSLTSPPLSRTSTIVNDIEHMPVDDDPRKWSPLRKNFTLFLVASASMIAGLSSNIQNPAVQEMLEDLHTTDSQFSLSISLFILVQGIMPLIWSPLSEIKGRKFVYLTSLAMTVIGSVAIALSPNMSCVIGFRCLQATGSSAVMTIGASTLADIFDPEVRGTKMGIYYMAPLLGPAIGPILGGALTTAFHWRAIFWFLAIYAGLCCLSFIFFRDTYRKERSLVYQHALKSRLKHLQKADNIERTRKSSAASSVTADSTKSLGEMTIVDEEKGMDAKPDYSQVKVSLKDVSPFEHVWHCLRRLNNLATLLATGLFFSYCYMVTYAAARMLAFGYGYNAMKIGLVTLSFGIGSILGSVCGGRWSDRTLAKLKEAHGGKGYPEMRLKSPMLAIVMMPPLIVIMGWIWQEHVPIAAVCVLLFVNGFFYIWPYASAVAYIVDANQGRSSTAVATNSLFRGILAFIATELAVPLQEGLGNGWMMTLWAFIMALAGLLILATYWKGKSWREKAESREAASF